MVQQKKPRRRRRRKQNRRQASPGCFLPLFLFLLLLLLGGYILSGVQDISGGRSPTLPENPYTPADFVMQNGYVTCTAGPTRRGIDVSAYQEDIDWDQVRAAGFDFAFIRIGYRGYSTGSIQEDERARENLAGAKSAGLDVGVYFYAQAITTEEAAEEAAWCLEFLAGEALDLPVVYDWEWVSESARTGSMDRATLTECVKTFCEAIGQGGYQAMIYFNKHVSRDLLDLEELSQYPFWLAQYKEQMDYPYQVDFWQYTEEGTVPGIEGDVDIDLMFLYE